MRLGTFNFTIERQYFGGGGSTPSVPAAPPVAPSPVPTETTTGSNLEGRSRQVAMLKYGALSTISNTGGAAGIASGVEMYPSMTAGTQGKQTLGGN